MWAYVTAHIHALYTHLCICVCVCEWENAPTNRNVAKSAHMSHTPHTHAHTRTRMLTLPLRVCVHTYVCHFPASFSCALFLVKIGEVRGWFFQPTRRYIFCAFLFSTHARARHTYAYVCMCMTVICCVYDFILLFSFSFLSFLWTDVAADAGVELSLCKTQLACMEYEK